MMDNSWNNRNEEWKRMESELAALKREHEQLRAAVENVKTRLEQGSLHRTDSAAMALHIASDEQRFECAARDEDAIARLQSERARFDMEAHFLRNKLTTLRAAVSFGCARLSRGDSPASVCETLGEAIEASR
jgi:chromosome segregation ATPase